MTGFPGVVPAEQEQFLRVLRQRLRSERVRLLQGLLIGGLAWLALRDTSAAAWLVGVLATGLVESAVARRANNAADPWTHRASVTASQALSSTLFSLVAAVLVVPTPTPTRLAEAGFALCAVALNNAITALGSRRSTAALVGPPAGLLVLAPLWVGLAGQGIALPDMLLLAAGGGAYIAFIVQLSATMARERDAVNRAALEAQAGNDRWEMVFHNSPMARICFDASALHRRLHEGVRAGHVSLGMALLDRDGSGQIQPDDIQILETNNEARTLLKRYGGAGAFGADFVKTFAMALDNMAPDGAIPPFDAPITLEDGGVRILRIYHRLTPGQGGPWSLCLGAYEDVTEARRTAQAQEDARRAAEEANRAKSDFLTVMSHEIRTPLNGVLGMAQAMDQDTLSDPQRQRLRVIRESGGALAGLLDDLLDISRRHGDAPTAGKRDLDLRAHDAAEPPRDPAPESLPEGVLRVLAAEDNEVNRMVLKALLAQFDIDPTFVEDGAEAVRAWESSHWDVILMDVQMPVMDGPTATMTIRAREVVTGRPRTPILAVTANTMPHQVASYHAAGMDDVVGKPLNVSELFGAMLAAVGPDEADEVRAQAVF